MNWAITFLIIMIILFGLFFLGEWVAFALGTTGVIGLMLFGVPNATTALNSIGSIVWNNSISYTMTAIPMFVLMGEIVLRSDISSKFYRGLSKLIGRLPGGLLQSNIVATAFFAAISGSAVATAAAIGSVSIPELSKRRYNSDMLFGTLAAGGTLGLLIPPSITMIIYGTLTNGSVSKLFMAGLIPGIILALIFCIYVGIRCKLDPTLTPPPETGFSGKEKLHAVLDVLPMIIIMAVIFICLYAGVATPTEVAAIGCLLAFIFAALNRKLKIRIIIDSMVSAAKTTVVLMLIIVGAQIFNFLLVNTGINRSVTTWLMSLNMTKFGFFLICILIYLLLGCLMESACMLYLTMPVLYPVVQAFGINTYFFAVFIVVMAQVACLTPPIGMNLFVIHGIANNYENPEDPKGGFRLGQVIKGSMPFFAIMLAYVFVLYFCPFLCTWLPGTM